MSPAIRAAACLWIGALIASCGDRAPAPVPAPRVIEGDGASDATTDEPGDGATDGGARTSVQAEPTKARIDKLRRAVDSAASLDALVELATARAASSKQPSERVSMLLVSARALYFKGDFHLRQQGTLQSMRQAFTRGAWTATCPAGAGENHL